MILVVYDAPVDRGYWLYVQEHFELKDTLPARASTSVTVHVPSANILVEHSIRHFAAAKAAVQAQTKGVKHHG